ncbi:(2Fe-2S)-binding protein [Streptomyces sp. NPDC058000]|uniref:(2Fe-2S)-binding protein n=1 Tax=Streptomyces sp. NPDC058000 TaxID=3346299 RepID=UPI0036EDCE50
MSPRRVRAESDAVGRQDRPLRIMVDGEPVGGIAGQTIAGVMLAADRLAWRRGRSGAPRGVFCGIGVCFDCLVTVGDERDVRACRRRARDGDVVTTQTREPAPGGSQDAKTVLSPGPGTAQDAEPSRHPAPAGHEKSDAPGTEAR